MPADRPKRTLDQSSIEATLRGAGVMENPIVLAALAKAVGYDPAKPQPSYDWSVHEVMEEVIPAVLGWPGSHDEHLYRLGRASFIGWGATIVGRVLSAPISQSTPQRAIQIMVRLMFLTPQFGTSVLTQRGPRDFQLRAEGDPRHPWLVAGLIVPAVEIAGGQGVTWAAEVIGPEAYILDVIWAEDGPPFLTRITL
jgi:uncharacterized protein (TIGR02265 family)